MNKKYGEGTVELEIVESYYNMREKIEPCMHLVDTARKAIEKRRTYAGCISGARRYGRSETQLQGPALPEPWDRRLRVPWPL